MGLALRCLPRHAASHFEYGPGIASFADGMPLAARLAIQRQPARIPVDQRPVLHCEALTSISDVGLTHSILLEHSPARFPPRDFNKLATGFF